MVWLILKPSAIWDVATDVGKGCRKKLHLLGYDQRCKQMPATAYGAAIAQTRLMVLYLRRPTDVGLQDRMQWTWPLVSTGPTRPMSNLLRPYQIPRSAYRNRLTEDTQAKAPNSTTDPMPSSVDAIIRTPRGYRVLLPDELAKGLGLPSASIYKSLVDSSSQTLGNHLTRRGQ